MRKLNVTVIIGVIVAVLGAGMVLAYGQTVDRRVSEGKSPVNVLVADGDLSAGTPASELRGRVHVVRMPSAFAVDNALNSVDALADEVEGTSVLTGPVPRGGQLAQSMFADPAAAGRVNPAKGHVALAVQTDLAPGVARYLAVGEHVDVFGTYQNARSSTGNVSKASDRTKLFASHVKVLAVSVAEQENSDDSSADDLTDKTVVLLELSPRDAERVVNANTLGSVYLA